MGIIGYGGEDGSHDSRRVIVSYRNIRLYIYYRSFISFIFWLKYGSKIFHELAW